MSKVLKWRIFFLLIVGGVATLMVFASFELDYYNGYGVDDPTATVVDQSLPWAAKYNPILGSNVFIPFIVVLVSFVAGFVGWRWVHQMKEHPPGEPLIYEPPEGLCPAQLEYAITEDVDSGLALLSTILYAAVKGLVVVVRGKHSWTVEGVKSGEEWVTTVDPVTVAVGKMLGVNREGGRFIVGGGRIIETGKVLRHVQDQYFPGNYTISGSLAQWGVADEYFQLSTQETMRKLVMIFTFPIFILLSMFSLSLSLPLIILLPLLVFMFVGLPVLSQSGGQKRTDKGRRLWAESAGFKRTITTNSAENRYNFAARRDLFLTYLPYAIMFDAAEEWERKYEIITVEPESQPGWYRTTSTIVGTPTGMVTLIGKDGVITSFNTAITTAIAAYQTSQNPPSSGDKN